jgi:hypothetical protein
MLRVIIFRTRLLSLAREGEAVKQIAAARLSTTAFDFEIFDISSILSGF